jgi:hypothetical protein
VSTDSSAGDFGGSFGVHRYLGFCCVTVGHDLSLFFEP